MFGSAANDLCIGGANDIDVTLELPGADDNEAKSAIVQRLGELFTAAGMLDVQVWEGKGRGRGCGQECPALALKIARYWSMFSNKAMVCLRACGTVLLHNLSDTYS